MLLCLAMFCCMTHWFRLASTPPNFDAMAPCGRDPAGEQALLPKIGRRGKPKTGFVWTFGAADAQGGFDVAYHFAESRSGATPRKLLEGSNGVLVVRWVQRLQRHREGLEPSPCRVPRARAALLLRIAQDSADRQKPLDLVCELYRVEHDAKEQRVSENAKLEFRKQRAGPIRKRLKAWLEDQRPRHPPRSPIAIAIKYTLGQWEELGVFLDDARVPLDNNASERSLRRIALGRKNYLFVGDVASGKSLAGLYSLVATCESRAINPFDYLADVLARVQDHPANALDQLLPAAWAASR